MRNARVSFLFAFVLLGMPLPGLPAEEREPSAFRTFTDKQNQRIEAQIVAISGDRRHIEIRRRDGRQFELEATKLSLDDQQFLRDWLNSGTSDDSAGSIQVFGNLPNETPIDVSAAEGRDDIVSVAALKAGWIALTASGEVLSFSDRLRGLDQVASISANTSWAICTKEDGTVWGSAGQQEAPEILTTAIHATTYAAQRLAILRDGSVKVWGGRFGTPEPVDPPMALSRALGVAARQGGVAVLEKGGIVHGWVPGETEVHTAALGKNAIAIQGGIFHFVVLTEDGEVYEWMGKSPESARIPPVVRDEGPFVAIRGNGSTRAAQREDGSWIAWGMNGAGIVDFINKLGPVPDLAFFSEPGKKDHGYVVWIEPKSGS